ncbi:MAG: PepSY domain-containing protein [Planctomycetota bacterium]
MRLLGLIPVALLLEACATSGFPSSIREDVGLVPAEKVIEVGLDASGGIAEVEFHVAASAVPEKVIAAANELMPQGEIVGCEKEYQGATLLWEVTKKVDGKDYEVLFDAGGHAIDWEIEVDAKDVPQAVIDVAKTEVSGGTVTKVEEIRDAAKALQQYHVKMTKDGIRYKIALSLDAKLLAVYREATAEIEVPLR